jgi:hypothetical protein
MNLEMLLAKHDIFDNAILRHGFADYNGGQSLMWCLPTRC